MARINLLPWRAERRKQRQREFYAMLGMAAVGGLLLSQLVTLYTTPVIYLYMERFSEWLAHRREQRALRNGSLQEPQA